MTNWLSDNWGNLVVGFILLVIVAAVIWSRVRKKGEGGCGCGCASCGGCCPKDSRKDR